jgi:sugar lactone lactonase YvrE
LVAFFIVFVNLSGPKPVVMKKILHVILVVCSIISNSLAQNISTYAGGSIGDNGPATSAFMETPYATALDVAGNIYIADYDHHRIRKVDGVTGIITTIAGTGDPFSLGDNGPALNASIGFPTSIAVDANGNVYFSDKVYGKVRKITASTGIITTVAGTGTSGYSGDNGPAANAQLSLPASIAIDAAGNILICDQGNHRIRKVTPGGNITTVVGTGTLGFAGDGGPAISAQLSSPSGIAVGSNGTVYIADGQNFRIRKVDSNNIITTIAGTGVSLGDGDGGPALSATFNVPYKVAVDNNGNVYVADITLSMSGGGTYNKIRKINTSGIIITVVGNAISGYSGDGGPAVNAAIGASPGVAVDGAGNIFISDQANRRVRKVNVSTGIINTIAGRTYFSASGDGGPAVDARVFVADIALYPNGDMLIADGRSRIRKITKSTGIITTIAGNDDVTSTGDNGPAANATLLLPLWIALSPTGTIYFCEYNRIRKISTNGTITTIAGNGTPGFSGDNGPAVNALLNYPSGLFVDASENIYFADTENHRVRKIDAAGIITTIAGTGTPGFNGDMMAPTSARLNYPRCVALDAAGMIYISDFQNRRIRKLSFHGDPVNTTLITTICGTGAIATSGDGGPADLAAMTGASRMIFDANGSMYISAGYVRKIQGGNIYPVAGYGTGGDGQLALNAEVRTPIGMALDSKGVLFIAESGKDRIRKVQAVATVNISNLNHNYNGTAKSASVSTIPAGMTVSVTYNGSATPPVSAGSYNVVATVTGPDPDYYGLATATLTINKVPLTVTANNASRNYGAANPTFTQTYSGFVNSETISVIDALPVSTTTAVATSAVGTYAITPAGGSDNNYSFNYVPGTLTINKAAVTATATNLSKIYGAANPVLAISYTGLLNGENSSVIDTPPTSSTTAIQCSNVGTYPITLAGGTDNNYNITRVNGTMTINKATVNVTAENKSKVFNTVNPSLTMTYSGFVCSDNSSVINTQPTLSTTAVTTSNVGTYPITVSGGTDNNYTFTYTPGTLSITKANQTITFNPFSQQCVLGTINLAATSDSGLPISYTSSNTAVATVSGNTLTTVGYGSANITASQPGSANYNAATPVVRTIVVNQPPVVQVSEPVTICSGSKSSVALSSTPSGATFTWIVKSVTNVTGGSGGSGSAINQVLTNNTTSQGTITYTVTPTLNGCVGSNKDVTVIVNPIPVVTFSPDAITICSGAVASLTPGSTISGTTFTYTASSNSPLVSGYSSGTGNISQTLINSDTISRQVTYVVMPTAGGCTGASKNFVVTLNPPITATITGNTTLCPGGSITLTANPSGPGYTYLWNNGATTRSIVVSTTSINSVTVSKAGYCSGAKGAKTVVANTTVTITQDGTLCSTGMVTLTATAGASYSWSTEETTQSIVVYNEGVYSANVIFANGCTGQNYTSVTRVPSNCPIPAPEPLGNEVQVFPSPANGSLTIRLTEPALHTFPVLFIDSYGREVTRFWFQQNEIEGSVETGSISPGMYLIKMVIPGKGSVTRKVSIMH